MTNNKGNCLWKLITMCNFTENLSYVEPNSDKHNASTWYMVHGNVCLVTLQNYVVVLSPVSTTRSNTGFNSVRF